MEKLYRFGISIPEELIKEFDDLIKGKSYTNRSEAIRDLIRQELVTKSWESNSEVAGAITLVYDHHKRELVNKIVSLQHKFQKIIVSTQHIHLDHDFCLEIIAVRGKAKQLQILSNSLRAIKGVKHTTLSGTTTGKKMF